MPISKYFKGEGSKVMSSMKKRYGEKKGESVFYATANKKGMNPTSRNTKSFKGSRKSKGDLAQGYRKAS